MAIQEVLVSKIFNYTSEPTKKVEGQFWFNPSTNVLSRYNGTAWKAITVSSDDVAVLSDGSKISLTNYLNTQIAALAEGIDTKQDKLKFYSEVSGSTPSVTISATNINLKGKVAEGSGTAASGLYSHAEGFSTTASSRGSHAEGYWTTALGQYSHAEGYETTASSDFQHVQGKYNIEDANNKYADIIGNGSAEANRSNAQTVSWEGISWSKTDIRAGGTDQDNATYSLSALSEGKQDKLKFYSEVDKSDDTSSDSTGSEINLKTLASQYGGSKINIFASQGESTSGKINLTSQAYSNSADGGAITLLSDGVRGDGGEITLKAKTIGDGITGPGGNINIIAESTQDDSGSNILLSANSIQLDGGLNGTALNTSIPANTDDNHILTTKAVKTELDKKQDKLKFYSEEGEGYYAKANISNTAHINLKAYDLDGGGHISIVADSAAPVGSDITLQSGSSDSCSKIVLYSPASASSGSITIDGELTGSSISTSIPTSNAVDTKVVSEKAVKTELDKKQDKLLYYSEVSGDNPSVTISVKNIKLTGKVAEGRSTASGDYSHAEGFGTTASGEGSHTEGRATTAKGNYSHAEGFSTTASGLYSHAEGYNTTASGAHSHAEGFSTTASGLYSHVEGRDTTASGNYSHAEGDNTKALSDRQHVQGKFNIEDANDKYADIIGNGTSNTARSNAATVSWEGISWSKTDIRAGGTDQDSAAHSLAAKQNATDNNLTTIDKTIVGAINEINSIFNVNALPTPITDVKTITTTLENLITDTQYANKPGTILINPNIKNTGAILVGEAITDISKAFPIYTDQPVTIAFKNINDFKVAGDIAGESFNYIISFGYINQNITSDSLTIATNNGVYTITPEGDAGFETLKISKIS